MVNITYLGHACFRLEYDGQSIVLDPYADNYVPGLRPLCVAANYVYCSHEHNDHGCKEVVDLLHCCGPKFSVEEILTDHDAEGGSLRGKNMVRIFRFGDVRVAHLGDLGRMLTEEEAAKLQNLDCLMIPVGGFFTIDPATAKAVIEKLKPRVVIPMHFRTDESGYDVIAHIADFTRLFEDVSHGGSQLCLDKDTPAQILVMEPMTMDMAARAKEYHARGFNCAQTVLCLLREYTGLSQKQALAIAGGFGGGLRSGEICGAISGAVMALGVCFPYYDSGDLAAKDKIAFLTKNCVEECGKQCGCVTCRELLGPNNDRSNCDRYILTCARIAEKMINENKE